jgi:hypothetical protein
MLVRVSFLSPASCSELTCNLVALKEEGFSFLLISPGVVNTAEVPPSEEQMKDIMEMFALFKTMYPHWTGPMTAPESVKLMLGIIDNLTVQDSGKFVSHKVSSLLSLLKDL